MLDDRHRAACAVTAAWLDAQRAVAAWSLVLTVAGVVFAAWVASRAGASGLCRWTLAASLVTGAVAAYFALRVRLDAALFRDLAAGTIARLDDLDIALQRLGLRAAPTLALTPPRTIDERIDGARALARKSLLVVALQTLLLAPCCWAALIHAHRP